MKILQQETGDLTREKGTVEGIVSREFLSGDVKNIRDNSENNEGHLHALEQRIICSTPTLH